MISAKALAQLKILEGAGRPDEPRRVRRVVIGLAAASLLGLLAGWARGEEAVRTIPEWLLPPAAVKQTFDRVYAVWPVEWRCTQEQDCGNRIERASEYSGTSSVVGGAMLLTAAHVALNNYADPGIMKAETRGRQWAVKVYSDVKADIVLFRLHADDVPDAKRTSLELRLLPPSPQELVWWVCRGGLLEDEWSVGRFLGEVPPARALAEAFSNPVYLINPILGGIAAGCSGAPIVDARGQIAGMVVSFLKGEGVLNVLAVRATDISVALRKALTAEAPPQSEDAQRAWSGSSPGTKAPLPTRPSFNMAPK